MLGLGWLLGGMKRVLLWLLWLWLLWLCLLLLMLVLLLLLQLLLLLLHVMLHNLLLLSPPHHLIMLKCLKVLDIDLLELLDLFSAVARHGVRPILRASTAC
jgi:hypothetical protein